MDKIPVITILGPTASGKTSLSIELAKKFNGEIVSADSMQIYKNMDIANASPTEKEKDNIRHHMMNFLEPKESFSVADYVNLANLAVEDIIARNKNVFLVGGTGLYIDSLLNNIHFTSDSFSSEIRNELQALYEENGVDYLLDIIKEFDNDSYNRLKTEKNPKRIIRCIEVFKTTGITQTELNLVSVSTPSKYKALKIGLKSEDRNFLYDRINNRVDLMLENGLLQETINFYNNTSSMTSSMAIGYKELKPYIDHKDSLENCIEKLKMSTRRYAKRQLTWFKKDSEINWFNIDIKSHDDIVSSCKKLIGEFLNG